MAKIAEIEERNGELWVRVGDISNGPDFPSGVQITMPDEVQRYHDIESCLREIVECDKESDFGINDECIFFREEESWSKSERLKAALDKAGELLNAQAARSQT